MVLEATYGWYWAADLIQALGFEVHLAHPLGLAWGNRRRKDDRLDARDLADLLRLGRLPESWIAPPATRELRELVRYRAKLVSKRTSCKAQVHSVLAKHGIPVAMNDLFGVGGNDLLDRLDLTGAYRLRVDSLRRFITALDTEIDVFDRHIHQTLKGHVHVELFSATSPSSMTPSVASSALPMSDRVAHSAGYRVGGSAAIGICRRALCAAVALLWCSSIPRRTNGRLVRL